MKFGSDVTLQLVTAIFASAFGSGFQHGYNSGVLNEIQNVTTEWIQRCPELDSPNSQCRVSSIEVTWIWAFTVSIFCLGGMVGGLSVGFVATAIGRRQGLIANNLFVFVGAMLMGISKRMDQYSLLIIGRFVIGISAGLAAGLTPMYLSEISPESVRGAVGTVYQLVITCSILLSQILGIESILGSDTLWPYLLAATAVPAVVQLLMLPFCPDSPKYCYLDQHNYQSAKQSLIWFRDTHVVEDELQELKAEEEKAQSEENVTLKDILLKQPLRKHLIIAVMMMLAQQLSGINAIIFYSTDVFISSGLSHSSAQYATLGMGAANVAMTIISIYFIERVGRKTLLSFGMVGMLVSTSLLAACLLVNDHENDTPEAAVGLASYLAVAAVIAFVMFFAIGPGPIPWFFVSELFAQSARPIATSIAVGVNWLANFLVSWGFNPLHTFLGSYVFFVFITLQLVFIAYIWAYVPETKDKKPGDTSSEYPEEQEEDYNLASPPTFQPNRDSV